MSRSSGRHFLQIPGPTNTPLSILAAIAKPTIDHRGPEFAGLGLDVLKRIRSVFKTEGPVIIYPTSGTGAWEAALVNTHSPGNRVLMFETGWFSTLSSSLTAVRLPQGHSADALRRQILEDANLSLGNGLGPLADRVFRIGHLGDFGDASVLGTLAAIKMGLKAQAVPYGDGAIEADRRSFRSTIGHGRSCRVARRRQSPEERCR